MFIDHQATTFVCYRTHGDLQLIIAVATNRAQHLAGQALRMNSYEWNSMVQVAQHECESGFSAGAAVRDFAFEPQNLKHSPLCRHSSGDNSSNCSDLGACYHVIPPYSCSLQKFPNLG